MPEKKTSRITLWVPESLEIDLMRISASEDRKLSDLITHLLMNYAYGHIRKCEGVGNVAISRDSHE